MNKRNISFILGLLAVFILGTGGYLGYIQYTELQTVASSKTAVEQELFLKEQKKSSLEKLIDAYASEREDLETVQDIVPTDKNIPEIIYQLEAIATKEAGMRFAGVSFNDTANGIPSDAADSSSLEDVEKLFLNVQVSGTYSSLKDYLEAIQKNIRLTDVSSISFSAVGGNTENGGPQLFEYRITMIVYYLPS